ncbi:MAG TPA: hypothetical protein DIC64_02785 [Alphaproteobacteria bacterium]|nr:hypothetical protein [Alphaproteobacteria bacterium]
MFEPEFVTLDTDNIVISACQALLEDSSDLCGYYMRIENNSNDKIQVLGKNLNLTDDRGNSYLQSENGFKGEILELNPGEYFEFEDLMPVHSSSAVLYGTCRIVKEKLNQVKDIKIPALELFSNKSIPVVLN